MSQERLFFEGIEDAAKEIARHYVDPKTGEKGVKALACRLRPNKSPSAAHTWWLDCCNTSRTEHNFTGEDWLALIKIGREIDCHSVLHFICDDANYSRPAPVEPESELTALLREWKAGQQRGAMLNDRILAAIEKAQSIVLRRTEQR